MCGIYGIVRRKQACDARHDRELAAMGEWLRARGPDGHGSFRSLDGRVLFGHRRLSILDLSDRGAQPMLSADGALAVTFNGEIYNFKLLRGELEQLGAVFRSDSDTEVLLHGYAHWGEKLLDRLRGMFAFALHDRSKNAVLLARDPYGVKPLYYADDGDCIRFASQVRALTDAGGVSREPSAAGLVGFYLLGSVPEPHSIASAVRALPAGHSAWIEDGVLGPARTYFELGSVWRGAQLADCPLLALSDARSELRASLASSVAHHLVADVPVGMFLSAGIDSGAIVGLCRDVLGAGAAITAVTLAFDELRGSANDEAPLAAEVARLYGAEHHVRVVQRAELESDLPKIFDAMDQPTIDGLNTWFVSKATREHGLKVALSGLGGDELLGGYPSFRDVPRFQAMVTRLGPLAALGPALRRSLAAVAGALPVSPKALSLLELGGSIAGAYLLKRGLFMPWELPEVMDAELAHRGLAELGVLDHIGGLLRVDPGSDHGRLSVLESSLYMRNQLLRDTDWTSMAFSLEVRVPWVDSELFARCARLSAQSEHVLSKRALGEAPSVPLPKAVRERPKTGFQTPIDRWLEQSPLLDAWRSRGLLRRERTHWSRRYAFCVGERYLAR